MTNIDPEATAGDTPIISRGPEESRPQFAVDDSKAHITYSSNCLVNATPEEVVVDFVRDTKRGRGPGNTSLLTIESKVIMSPWAAKRLALALGRVIRNYEEIYGELEIDPRKRAGDSGAGVPVRT